MNALTFIVIGELPHLNANSSCIIGKLISTNLMLLFFGLSWF